jgi:hypothetical protein
MRCNEEYGDAALEFAAATPPTLAARQAIDAVELLTLKPRR